MFNCDMDYFQIRDALRAKDKTKFLYTIEFFPEEGKYHHDGHRVCSVCFSPQEAIKRNNLCPVCGKPLTIGVAHRVELLADRDEGFMPIDAPPFRSAIPLVEILSEVMSVGPQSKAVGNEYMRLLSSLGSEFTILLLTPLSEIEKASTLRVSEAIKRMREGFVRIKPGYDGEYGRVKIFEGVEEGRS